MKQYFTDKVTEILHKVSIVDNLARKKFISMFIIALIKSRNVQFNRIAHHLNDEAQIDSNEVRIQNFFRDVTLNYNEVAKLMISLLPKDKKLRLCIDRTEWDFGKHQVNILMVTVGYANFTLPIYFDLLDNKSGNSSYENRKDLLDLCIELLGEHRIGLIIGDREFVGRKWFKYLKKNKIKYIMRMPKNHYFHRPNGEIVDVRNLKIKVGQILKIKNCMVDGVIGNISIELLENGDYLYLFSSLAPTYIGQMYKNRWSIEALFQNLKGRGFDLEKTMLQNNEKLKKLVALVSLAYGFSTTLGKYHDRKVQKIKKKKHGYKSKSFTRKGIDLICGWTRPDKKVNELIEYMVKLFFRYLELQLSGFQT